MYKYILAMCHVITFEDCASPLSSSAFGLYETNSYSTLVSLTDNP